MEKEYELLGIKMSFEEFDQLMSAECQGKILVVENGKVIAKDYEPTQYEINMTRILDLKRFLNETDYQPLKYLDGEYTEEEYAVLKAQRQAWREEIRQLESKL